MKREREMVEVPIRLDSELIQRYLESSPMDLINAHLEIAMLQERIAELEATTKALTQFAKEVVREEEGWDGPEVSEEERAEPDPSAPPVQPDAAEPTS